MKKIRIDPEINGFALLRQAIIQQAVEDYQAALRDKRAYLYGKKDTPEKIIADCERFFLSCYFVELSGADGSAIIWKARKNAKREAAYRTLEPEKMRTELHKSDADDFELLKEAYVFICNSEFSTPKERKAARQWMRANKVRANGKRVKSHEWTKVPL